VLNQQTPDATGCWSSEAKAKDTLKGKAPIGKPKGERQQRETGTKGYSKRQQQRAKAKGRQDR